MPVPSTLSAGIDWGGAKLSAAGWHGTGGARLVRTADGRSHVPAAVRFEKARNRPGALEPVFPLLDVDLTQPHALTFTDLKNRFALYADRDVQLFVAGSVFGYWRTLLGEHVHLAVSVPFEYAWDTCQVLCAAAVEAGFEKCDAVPEALAAVLAHFPSWKDDKTRIAALRRGVHVWVVDCGSLDLVVTVLGVRVKDDVIDVAFLAAHATEGLGGEAPADRSAALAAMRESATHLRAVASAIAWPREPHRAGAASPVWVIPCGGGGMLEEAVDAVASSIAGTSVAAAHLPPVETVAHGSAVYSAMQSGLLAYRIYTTRQMLIGLKTDGESGSAFTPLTSPDDEPRCSFERAFRVPPVGRRKVEVSLAAALPGGGRQTIVWSRVLQAEEVARLKNGVLLVSGQLESWAGGSVSVRDIASGIALGEGRFRLPS